MISAILMGRKGSVGFPGKNLYPVMGQPLAYYPMIAGKEAHKVDEVFLSTDCEQLMALADKHNVTVIKRPAYLCAKDALGDHVYEHAYKEITKLRGEQEFFVLLMCNAATVSSEIIDQGIDVLRKNPDYDSAVTVSRYNMWSPLRARRENAQGLLEPFIPFEAYGDVNNLSCDRDSQGDVFFADMGASIVRPHCLANLEDGILPQKWMGRRIYPLKQEGGCDVDYEFQILQTKYWLKEYQKKKVNIS